MTDVDELMKVASSILKGLDGRFSVIETMLILNIMVSLYQGAAIKSSIDAKGGKKTMRGDVLNWRGYE